MFKINSCALLLYIFCSSCAAITHEPTIQVVHNFVKSEFELAQDSRALFCAYKLDGVLKLGSDFSPSSANPAVYLLFENDQIAVVKNYKVTTKTVELDKAEIVVNYDLLFTSEGTPRRFIKSIKSEEVIYKVVMINNEWKIIDPPIPRVSYDLIISFYSDQIQNLQKIVELKKASSAQIKSLEKLKADFDTLKTLN